MVLDALVTVCAREYAWARRGECVAWYLYVRFGEAVMTQPRSLPE
jgi:hypothetical protein